MRSRPAVLLPLLAATALAAGCGARPPAVPRATAHPLRVMSINQCADQLVLALLPPARITSVTWLSRDPGGSLMAAAARRVPVNHALAEEVLAQRPDLVVAGSFTTPALRAMLKRLGYPLIEIDQPDGMAAIRRVTRQVAAAVGAAARGEALLADMDRKLAELARDPAPRIPVVAWDRTGFAAGEGSIYAAILAAAGARSLVRGASALDYGAPDVEVLLAAAPALLVQGASDPAAPSLADDVLRHPVVRRLWGARTLTIPQAYYVCGTPMTADAAVGLRAALRRAAASAAAAPPPRSTAR